MNAFSRYSAFFQEYRLIQQKNRKRREEEQFRRFTQVITDVQVLKEQEAKRALEVAAGYNIFDVLNVRSYETKTHTPFISDLLDIRGAHCQQDLFYQTFIQQLQLPEKCQQYFLNYNPYHLFIDQEKATGNGFIDILIHHQNPTHPYAIIIENKIYAGDQPKQMERYYDYARHKLGLSKHQLLLIYLTIDGKDPSPGSLAERLRKPLARGKIYLPFSYRNGVREWLEKSKKQVGAPKIKYMLEQYLQTIQQL